MVVTMHIYMVKTFKNLLLRAISHKVLKLGMENQGLKLYKVHLNEDPQLTVTYFTTWVTCGLLCTCMGKTVTES